MHIKLKPGFSFEDVLRTSWSIFTKDPAVFLLFPTLMNLPFLFFIIYFSSPSIGEIFINRIKEGEPLSIFSFILLFLGIYIVIIILGILTPLIIAILTEDATQGHSLDLKKTTKKAFNRFFPQLGTSIIQTILLFLLFLLLIIPGIIFSIYWMFTPSIVALRNKWAFDGLKYSKKLVKGKWWKVFGYSILFGIIMGVPIWIISILIEWRIQNIIIQMFVLTTIQILVTTFSYIFYVVFFLFLEHEYKQKTNT